jgi:hypothetical protein
MKFVASKWGLKEFAILDRNGRKLLADEKAAS